MKFLASMAVAASLASSVAAAAASAPVYLLRAPSSSSPSESTSSTPPDLPRQIVRQILLRRLDASDGSSFLGNLPRNYDPETALDFIQQFGGKAATPALFADEPASRPREMLVVVQGAKPQHVAAIEAALPSAFAKPAFTVADPPSERANTCFFVDELAREGIIAHTHVAVVNAASDGVSEAWRTGIIVGLFDNKEHSETVDELVSFLPQILDLVQNGGADVTLLLLPEASRNAPWQHWATLQPAAGKINPPKAYKENIELLRARTADFESVIVEDATAHESNRKESGNGFASPPHEFIASAPPAAPAAAIPSCFQSFNSCIAQTGNCSQHGTCIDKFAANSGSLNGGAAAPAGAGAKQGPAGSCFVCHCFSTLNRPEDSPGGLSTTHWGGNMCQKKDISVPFWLITGFTVTIIGAVTFAIGLLFSVGEEKLPGVIGAGVSRTK